MKMLDLFCCEGVGARGYQCAGFEVIGIDVEDRFQKRYPGAFKCMDWREALDTYIGGVDFVHASPPCQGYSRATAGNPSARAKHPRLIEPVREALKATGVPFVIENVFGARSEMESPVTLCGTMFGLSATDDDGTALEMHRHRLFEAHGFTLTSPGPCNHGAISSQVAGSYGGARRDKDEARNIRKGGYVPSKPVQAQLIGVSVDEHTLHGLWQSIPPAYTEHVGRQVLKHLTREKERA